MKKTLFAILLAALTILCSFSPVFADSNGDEINWDDVSEIVEKTPELKGAFVTLKELPVKFYIPDSFKEVELTQEDIDAGIIAYYAKGNYDFEVAVYYYITDSDNYTFDDYKKLLKDEYKVEDTDTIYVNGYEALGYMYPDNDKLAFLTFITTDSRILEFVFAPADNEETTSYAAVVMASIMNAED